MDATPPDDPAARFRKPGEQPAAQPAAQPAVQPAVQPAAQPPATPPPAPAGFLQLVEDTLTAPFGLGTVFVRHAKAAAPGYPALVANTAVYAAAFLALNILRARLMFPDAAGRYSAEHLALAGTLGLLLLVPLSFVWAGALHALARASGGAGDYRRSYQALSLLSLFWPVMAAANAARYGWVAVLLFWALVASVAVENLHRAPPGQTRAVFGGAALAGIAAIWVVSLQVDKVLAPFLQAQRAQAELARELLEAQAAQRLALDPARAGSPEAVAQAQQLMLQAQQMMQASGVARISTGTAGSSLGLAALPTAEQAAATLQAMPPEAAHQLATTTLDSVLPLLENPALTKGLPPEQAKQVREMSALVRTLQDNAKSGKPATPQQRAQMQQMQQTMLQMMMQNMQKGGKGPQAQGSQTPPAQESKR
ncbi:MAG: hypothetical protein HY077_10115 [Elusimicrobia bacterium]|nr:hypothetical protein [Elusimicrobiota bacterium]